MTTSRRQWGISLLVLGLMALAVLFRLADFSTRNLWTDEAWVALAVLKPTPGEALAAGQSNEEWRSLLSITLDGSFFCTKACLPSMIAAGGGSIVTLGGMTALSGAKKRVHGSVGKHGLWGMTRALAKELGEHQINVNCVAPGQMDTARAADRSERAPVTNVPMRRRSTPEEVAGIVRYLCTPAAKMISGQLIYVDGGQQMF